MKYQRWHLFVLLVVAMLPLQMAAFGHDWHRHASRDSDADVQEMTSVETVAPTGLRHPELLLTAFEPASSKPPAAQHFEHFQNLKVRWDENTLYVESNGLPDHNMMVGIRSWQQQVPLPQPFTGSNAWKIPRHPRLAGRPINAKQTPFRGAIAVAVNGVPIFTALNNRGDDAYLAGELDNWGGHCGRGDDYHYHIAPLHLENVVGKGNPIAYALDGFPIYGLTEADGSPVGPLDELNGQFDADGNYHYHATKTYPYINGGIRGVVDYRNGEIASQPRDSPVRPGQNPLRGATITDFKTSGNTSVLTYQLAGRTGRITYRPAGTNSFAFTFDEPNGRTWSETYERRRRPDDRGEPNDRRGPPPDRRPPPPPRR